MITDHAKVKSEFEFLTQLDVGPGRKTVLNCMQCGVCSGSCPLGDVMEYPPRQMILNARSGYLDEVLKSPSLWMCIGCYTCSHRCPRAIELTDGLWPAMRDKAMQNGSSAAPRASGCVPERLQVRQFPGRVAAQTDGMGGESGCASARPLEGADERGSALAGVRLSRLLSAKPRRHTRVRSDSDGSGRPLGSAWQQGADHRRLRSALRRGGAFRVVGGV